jgi:hypothetical protein
MIHAYAVGNKQGQTKNLELVGHLLTTETTAFLKVLKPLCN